MKNYSPVIEMASAPNVSGRWNEHRRVGDVESAEPNMKRRAETKRKSNSAVLFKVLDGFESCNGGRQTWKLNEWYSIGGELVMCKRGFHLTLNPTEWKGGSVYFAEAQGIKEWSDDKCVARRVKLLGLCSAATLDEYYAKRKPIDDEYYAKLKPIYDEYYAKLKPIDDEYYAKRKPIDDEYYAKRKPIDDEYYAKLKTTIAALYRGSK